MEAWVAEPEVPSAEAAAAQVVLLEAAAGLVPPGGLAVVPAAGVAAGLLANAFRELQIQEASRFRGFFRLFIAMGFSLLECRDGADHAVLF